jgi:hypothetical protein
MNRAVIRPSLGGAQGLQGRTSAVIAIVLSIVAVLVSVASVIYTRTVAVASKGVHKIERDRRHDELTPRFDITCKVRDTAPDWADMHITLAKGGAQHLDSVVIRILDEAGVNRWGNGRPDDVTPEEAQAFVWGPWEFNSGASEQVRGSRETKPRPYSRESGRNWDKLGLVPTRPGRWMTGTTGEAWRKQYHDQPVRLLLTCRREGEESWVIQRDVRVEYPRGAGLGAQNNAEGDSR